MWRCHVFTVRAGNPRNSLKFNIYNKISFQVQAHAINHDACALYLLHNSSRDWSDILSTSNTLEVLSGFTSPSNSDYRKRKSKCGSRIGEFDGENKLLAQWWNPRMNNKPFLTVSQPSLFEREKTPACDQVKAIRRGLDCEWPLVLAISAKCRHARKNAWAPARGRILRRGATRLLAERPIFLRARAFRRNRQDWRLLAV